MTANPPASVATEPDPTNAVLTAATPDLTAPVLTSPAQADQVGPMLLAIARQYIGSSEVGDPVPGWLYKVMQQCGVEMKHLPIDYKGFIDESAQIGIRTDWKRLQPGDVEIFQYQHEDWYWMGVVSEIMERSHKVILAVAGAYYFAPEDCTIVAEHDLPTPNVADNWHAIALLHFSIK